VRNCTTKKRIRKTRAGRPITVINNNNNNNKVWMLPSSAEMDCVILCGDVAGRKEKISLIAGTF
jgi:hypothetical protein